MLNRIVCELELQAFLGPAPQSEAEVSRQVKFFKAKALQEEIRKLYEVVMNYKNCFW